MSLLRRLRRLCDGDCPLDSNLGGVGLLRPARPASLADRRRCAIAADLPPRALTAAAAAPRSGGVVDVAGREIKSAGAAVSQSSSATSCDAILAAGSAH